MLAGSNRSGELRIGVARFGRAWWVLVRRGRIVEDWSCRQRWVQAGIDLERYGRSGGDWLGAVW